MPKHTRDFVWNPDPVADEITGEQLATARRLAGYSQKELAQLLQHGERTIQNWERDGVHPSKVPLVRKRLGNYLRQEGEPQPLATYSNWDLVAEIMRRLETRGAAAVEPSPQPDKDEHKRGRGARNIDNNQDDDDQT